LRIRGIMSTWEEGPIVSIEKAEGPCRQKQTAKKRTQKILDSIGCLVGKTINTLKNEKMAFGQEPRVYSG